MVIIFAFLWKLVGVACLFTIGACFLAFFRGDL